VPKSKKQRESRAETQPNAKGQRDQQLQKITTYTGIIVLVIVVALVGFYLLSGRAPAGGPTAAEDVDFRLDFQPSLGEPDAPVKVVEFGDYKCPACAYFHEQVFFDLKRDYIDTGKVEFFFINFPIIGPDSITAGIAGECIYHQSEPAFWAYHGAVYENQGPESRLWATPAFLLELVRQHVKVKIDEAELERCIADERYRKDVEQDGKIGEAAGVRATPSIFVNGQKVDYPSYKAIKAAIEKELAKSEG